MHVHKIAIYRGRVSPKQLAIRKNQSFRDGRRKALEHQETHEGEERQTSGCKEGSSKYRRASTDSSGAATTPSFSKRDSSTITSTSSSVSPLQYERERPQLSADPSESESIVEGLDVSSDEYESEDDSFDDERAQDVFDQFILSLPVDHRRMLAVLLAESFRTRQGMGVLDASREVGSIIGYSEKTVRKLRKEFYENEGSSRRERTESTNE